MADLGFNSVNVDELKQLEETMLSEMKVLDTGFYEFILTVEQLQRSGFIQGQLGEELSNVSYKVQGVREQYSRCHGSVRDQLTRAIQTALDTDSKYYSNLVEIAAMNPGTFSGGTV